MTRSLNCKLCLHKSLLYAIYKYPVTVLILLRTVEHAVLLNRLPGQLPP